METGDLLEEESYEYCGRVALCCGASPAQTAALGTQTSLTNQILNQGQQVFGSSSKVFSGLVNTMAPTVAAGPNQEGFSAAENANLESQAITENGQAYKNAKAATGNAIAAQNGGNNPSTTSGTTAGVDANLASSAASNTANELGKIREQNYATGRQNYDAAVKGLSGATDVFNPVTSLDNAGTNAAEDESNTANQIATQSNSWIQGVTGALGTVAGAAVGRIPSLGRSSSPNGNTLAAVAEGNSTPVATSDDWGSGSLIEP